MPNPSGLNAHYTPAQLAKVFSALRRACDERGERRSCCRPAFGRRRRNAKKSTGYYLQALKDAPTGDRWETLWEEVEKLHVPEGPRSAYFDNRKAQVHYFMNDNSDWPAIENAARDLKEELADYRRRLSTGDPALAQ